MSAGLSRGTRRAGSDALAWNAVRCPVRQHRRRNRRSLHGHCPAKNGPFDCCHRPIFARATRPTRGAGGALCCSHDGTQFVGAIHGRLLTAWSTAGIIGPVVVNYIREFQLAAVVPRDQLYNTTMYVLCGMLVIGLICNYLVNPVNPKWYMSREEVAKLQAANARTAATTPSGSFGIGKGGLDVQAAIFWAFVGIPLA